ncbi:DUF2358 domain-containing protein [Trichothermofontia sp.]
MDIVDILKADYARFPQQQTYGIYAPDVYFQDPLNSFHGVDRYRRMIGFIERWFQQPCLELHDIQRAGQHITTHWTLSWTSPLPWRPRISIPGWSELTLNDQALIVAHIDHWHCSRLAVLRQHFFPQGDR